MLRKFLISQPRAAVPTSFLWATALLAAIALALALPSGLAIALGVAAAVGLATLLAEFRRHGGGDVPALPFSPED